MKKKQKKKKYHNDNTAGHYRPIAKTYIEYQECKATNMKLMGVFQMTTKDRRPK